MGQAHSRVWFVRTKEFARNDRWLHTSELIASPVNNPDTQRTNVTPSTAPAVQRERGGTGADVRWRGDVNTMNGNWRVWQRSSNVSALVSTPAPLPTQPPPPTMVWMSQSEGGSFNHAKTDCCVMKFQEDTEGRRHRGLWLSDWGNDQITPNGWQRSIFIVGSLALSKWKPHTQWGPSAQSSQRLSPRRSQMSVHTMYFETHQ